MAWIQKQIRLPALPRGFHIVTREVLSEVPELSQIETGLMHVFIMHTSASLSINENADPDVPVDLEMSFNKIAPESFPYIHTCEGPDDMPAHVRSILTGSDLNIPVMDGRCALGTWQGIYLCEHRDHAGGRTVVVTLNGA